MDWNFSKMTELFTTEGKSRLLLDGKWGLEKESQRITLNGDLALTNHPVAFGDKLENPYVTTDFSESQMELITPPFPSVEETYDFLYTTQVGVEKELANELLWPLSMPPRLPDEEKIPLARFNDSLEGREKEVYRQGLALRYGKKKQMISGLHYNFSFGNELLNYLYQQLGQEKATIHGKPEFINDLYLALTRNYLRYHWLLIYLFGASPANDSTYDSVICQKIEAMVKCCPNCSTIFKNYRQYATSLRVSRFGYSYTGQRKRGLHFNSLLEYTQTLGQLLATKSKKYAKLGIYQNDSQIQLNDNVLQKESEFYSPIRLKQNLGKGETQLQALAERGIGYLEVRVLDLNPFEKTGISIEQLYFLQIFMLYCLFEQSGFITDLELARINENHHLVALSGRKPNLRLRHYSRGPIALKDWGKEIFLKLNVIAALLDKNISSNKYRKSVLKEYAKILDQSLLPASRVIKEMDDNQDSLLYFGLRRAKIHLAENILKNSEVNYG